MSLQIKADVSMLCETFGWFSKETIEKKIWKWILRNILIMGLCAIMTFISAYFKIWEHLLKPDKNIAHTKRKKTINGD